jgi:autotransporter passenger strand-loop-strand repeat protein
VLALDHTMLGSTLIVVVASERRKAFRVENILDRSDRGFRSPGAIVDRGGTDRVSGRDTSATLNGGMEVVSRTGVGSGAIILGGGVTVATILFGGTETVSSAGTASSTLVLSGGSSYPTRLPIRQ